MSAITPSPVTLGLGGRLGASKSLLWGGGLTLLWILLALTAWFVAPYDPTAQDLTIMAWGDPSLRRLATYRDLGFNRVVLGGGRREGNDPSTTFSFLDRYAVMVDELL